MAVSVQQLDTLATLVDTLEIALDDKVASLKKSIADAKTQLNALANDAAPTLIYKTIEDVFDNVLPDKNIVSISDTGQFNLKFSLTTKFGGGALPSISSNFVVKDFSLSSAVPKTIPSVAFENVQIELGSFFDKFATPIIEKIKLVTKPLEPLVNFFTTDIGLFNKIAEVAPSAVSLLNTDGKGGVNLLDLADFALNLQGKPPINRTFINAVKAINGLSIPKDGISISLGNFELGGASFGGSTIDFSKIAPANLKAPTLGTFDQQLDKDNTAKNFFNLLKFDGGPFQFPILSDPTKAFGLLLGQTVDLFTYDAPALEINFPFEKFFPIIGPLGITIKGDVGAKVDLGFGFDTAGLKEFKASNFKDPSKILEGFYVSDRAKADGTGADVPEATLNASLRAFAALDVAVARAGAGGGIYGTVFANLVDPDGDGKVRPSEFNLTSLFDLSGKIEAGLEAFYEIGFPDESFLGVPLGVRDEFRSDTITIFEFGGGSKSPSNKPPILATKLGDGTLRLNMGPNATDRKEFNIDDVDETFVVTFASQKVNVVAFDFTQTDYGDVSKIVANGDKLGDIIKLAPEITISSELTGGDGSDEITGGSGVDTIFGGADSDKIFGGDSGDFLYGGDEPLTLDNKILLGDQIFGGKGEDRIFGNAGNDFLYGEQNNDTIEGGSGNDYINGGDGIDSLFGQDGNDILIGGANGDFLYGGDDNDILDGGAEVDRLFGDAGEDQLNGGDEADFLYGGADKDVLLGDAGNDFLRGDAGNDKISGGSGRDTVSYETSTGKVLANIDENQNYSNDASEAELGYIFTANAAEAKDGLGFTDSFNFSITRNVYENKSIQPTQKTQVFSSEDLEDLIGSNQSDILIGNKSNNTIQGLDGTDLLIGNAGSDELDGGNGRDTVSYRRDLKRVIVNLETNTATDGSGAKDTLISIENIVGSDSRDEIIGDELTGDGNLNIILAGKGNDTLKGGIGDDILRGEADNDQIFGGQGVDTIDGGADNDTVRYDDSTSGTVVNIDENNDYTNAYSANIAPFSFNIAKGKAQDGFGTIDTLTNLENITGSNFSDVLIGNEVDNTIKGLAGNDLLIGNAGLDTLEGGTGNDSFFGGKGNDIIDGGADIDTVIYDNSDNGVTVNIDETTDYSNTKVGIDIEPTFTINKGRARDGFGDTDTLKNLENIIGSKSNDILIGNEFDNTILGLAEDDLFIGNKGNDTLDGGDRTDTVSYRRDPSRVIVDLPNQTAKDGFGSTDTLLNIENVVGSKFDDEITGDAKVNKIIGGDGKDTINGGAGDDLLYGEAGDDTISGGLDKDFIDGGTGDDILKGEAGQDTILGGLNDDELSGGTENDDLNGNAGNDKLFGDANDDLLKGEAGDDFIDGGTEIDTVSYDNSPKGVVVNIDEAQSFQAPGGILRQTVFVTSIIPTDLEQKFTISSGSAQDGFGTTDTLRNLENIIGSRFNDVLIGNSSFNKLTGLAGDDVFISSVSDDFFDGGADIDTVSYRRDPSAVNVSLEQNKATDGFGNTDQLFNIENVIGTAFSDQIVGDARNNIIFAGAGDDIVNTRDGNDILFGQAGRDNLFGENGDDFLVGGTEADLLDGGNGSDTASYFDATSGVELSLETSEGFAGDANGDRFVSIENIEGSEFSDLLIGNQENNILSGIGGDDRLYGQAGDDTLYGGLGRDRLYGGDGNDKLLGGEDNDVLYGLGGNDLLDGADGDDQLFGSDGDDTIRGGRGVDTAIYNGVRSRYSVTKSNGLFTITSNDTGEGIDTLYNVEKIQFSDQTHSIDSVIKVSEFEASPTQFFGLIRDYDGNNLGASGSWKSLGKADIQADGDLESIFVNSEIGRWASVGSINGSVDFDNYGLNGDTRVVGIYIDPTLKNTPENIGGPFDSQKRFQNDLRINNLSVLGASDFDKDGFQDLYFKVNDGTSVLRAIMFGDGNIQYANYQSKDDLTQFMTANNVNPSIWSSWI